MNRKEAKDRSQAGRFLAYDKNGEYKVNAVAVIAGIQDYERALAYHREALHHKPRKEVREAIAAKLRELKDD